MRVAIATVAAVLIFASMAFAAQTKETYKTAVEPICKANKAKSDKYLKPVKGLVKSDKLKQASEDFTKAAKALEETQKKLAAVPAPETDTATISKWLSGIKGEISLMKTIATKLNKGQKGPASSLSVKLSHNADATNALVFSYSFNYCKIDPSKYT
jgi:hypothetical protein